jgi:hypothetical protein
MFEQCVNLGGLIVSLLSTGDESFSVDKNYLPFITSEPAQLSITQVIVESLPLLSEWHESFTTGGLGTFYRKNGSWAVSLQSPALGPTPYRMAVFENHRPQGIVYTRMASPGNKPLPFPLQYPLGEILASHYLDQVNGLVIHSCGVLDGDRGYLFAGVSGAGKSTMSKIWSTVPGVVVLNDDRIILNKNGKQVWMQGTPWHGDFGLVSAQKVPIQKVFILKHYPENQVHSISPAMLARQLFIRSFPPYWDEGRLDRMLQILDQICQNISGFELRFVPDSSVVDFVRSLPAD